MSNFEYSLAWFEKLGCKKGWDWTLAPDVRWALPFRRAVLLLLGLRPRVGHSPGYSTKVFERDLRRGRAPPQIRRRSRLIDYRGGRWLTTYHPRVGKLPRNPERRPTQKTALHRQRRLGRSAVVPPSARNQTPHLRS